MSSELDGANGDDRKRNKKRALVIVAGLLAASGVGSLAFAYWTESGSTTGSAGVGSTSALTLNATNTPGGLYPGGPAVTLTGTFDNGNASKITVSSLKATITSVSNGAADNTKPACAATDFAFSNPVLGNGGVVLPGNGGGTWSIDLAMKNTAANQDNCKSASPQITFDAS